MKRLIQGLRKKLCGKSGFSLAELLTATIILVLASDLLARSVSLAAQNFIRETRKSEAQMLCAALVTSIQDELLYAREVDASGDRPTYFSSSRGLGSSCRLVLAEGEDGSMSDAGETGEVCVMTALPKETENGGATVQYYPLVDHASYGREGRSGPVGSGDSNFLNARLTYTWSEAEGQFSVRLQIVGGSGGGVLSEAQFGVRPFNYYNANATEDPIENNP